MGCAADEFKASIGPLRGKPPVEEAIALFKANPLRWFRDARGPYRWGQDLTNGRVWHTEDIGIYVGEQPIGYVERFSVTKETRTARIGHIAVAKGLEPVLSRVGEISGDVFRLANKNTTGNGVENG